jgi:hypothetical protein
MLNNILKIEGAVMLSKENQKTIKGGSGTCAVIIFSEHGFTPTIHQNIDCATSQSALAAATFGGRWCCDSCDQATWLNNVE